MATSHVPALAAYSAMTLGKHALWGLLSGLGLFYLTEELGVSPSLAGAILMASRLMDVAIDLPIGGLLDQWRARLPSYLVPVLGSVTICVGPDAISAGPARGSADREVPPEASRSARSKGATARRRRRP